MKYNENIQKLEIAFITAVIWSFLSVNEKKLSRPEHFFCLIFLVQKSRKSGIDFSIDHTHFIAYYQLYFSSQRLRRNFQHGERQSSNKTWILHSAPAFSQAKDAKNADRAHFSPLHYSSFFQNSGMTSSISTSIECF